MFRLLSALLLVATPAFGQSDPLPSWNDGAAKSAIIEFVEAVTTEGPDYVAPADRMATFDNDGSRSRRYLTTISSPSRRAASKA
jgi:hypothetical protein